MSEHTSIYIAVEAARTKFKTVKQSGRAQFGVHSTIKDIMDAVEMALFKEGVFINHEIRVDFSTGVPIDILVTRLIHITTKTEMKSEIVLNNMNRGPQGTGSALTYMRRYSLQVMLNLTPDKSSEDDGDFVSTGKRKTI
jgi:hypothetical protein|tara:strand:+ start:560 stop:976 length:417 start_codon:yes stop_codon:yes gene_type:complete